MESIELSAHEIEVLSHYFDEDEDPEFWEDYPNKIQPKDKALFDKFKGWKFYANPEKGTFDYEKSASYDFPIKVTDPEGNIYKTEGGYRSSNGYYWNHSKYVLVKQKPKPVKIPFKQLLADKLEEMEQEPLDNIPPYYRDGWNDAVAQLKEFISKSK